MYIRKKCNWIGLDQWCLNFTIIFLRAIKLLYNRNNNLKKRKLILKTQTYKYLRCEYWVKITVGYIGIWESLCQWTTVVIYSHCIWNISIDFYLLIIHCAGLLAIGGELPMRNEDGSYFFLLRMLTQAQLTQTTTMMKRMRQSIAQVKTRFQVKIELPRILSKPHFCAQILLVLQF